MKYTYTFQISYKTGTLRASIACTSIPIESLIGQISSLYRIYDIFLFLSMVKAYLLRKDNVIQL